MKENFNPITMVLTSSGASTDEMKCIRGIGSVSLEMGQMKRFVEVEGTQQAYELKKTAADRRVSIEGYRSRSCVCEVGMFHA